MTYTHRNDCVPCCLEIKGKSGILLQPGLVKCHPIYYAKAAGAIKPKWSCFVPLTSLDQLELKTSVACGNKWMHNLISQCLCCSWNILINVAPGLQLQLNDHIFVMSQLFWNFRKRPENTRRGEVIIYNTFNVGKESSWTQVMFSPNLTRILVL